MRKHRISGIYWRPGAGPDGGSWHIDKQVYGRRIRASCRTADQKEAEVYLAARVSEIRRSIQFGERPRRTFRDAAARYLRENQHKKSIGDDAWQLERLMPYLGDLALEDVHQGSMERFIADSRRKGNKANTINLHIAITRRICNLAASVWRDDAGLTWLQHAPKFVLLPTNDAKEPRPISWPEQAALLNGMAPHLQAMVLFAVNTGCRDQEVCGLQWDMEREVAGVMIEGKPARVFVIPRGAVKNKEPRLVVLNAAARRVIDGQRGLHTKFVFVCPTGSKKKDTKAWRPTTRIYNTGWKVAVRNAGLTGLRVHDLKHTYGRRLRAAGVPLETRQALLGHTTGSITTHYSAPEIEELIRASELVCEKTEGVLLRAVR